VSRDFVVGVVCGAAVGVAMGVATMLLLRGKKQNKANTRHVAYINETFSETM
jgi:gas vesicle protein